MDNVVAGPGALARRVLQEGDPVRRRAVVPVLGGFGPGATITPGASYVDAVFVRYVGDRSLVIKYPDGTLEQLQSRADLLD